MKIIANKQSSRKITEGDIIAVSQKNIEEHPQELKKFNRGVSIGTQYFMILKWVENYVLADIQKGYLINNTCLTLEDISNLVKPHLMLVTLDDKYFIVDDQSSIYNLGISFSSIDNVTKFIKENNLKVIYPEKIRMVIN